MKQTILLLIICVALGNCKAQNDHNLAIPDQVNVNKEKATSRFPGTNTFICKPADYTLVKQLVRFQKNEETFIQLVHFPFASNFEAKKKELDANFQNAVAAGKLQKEYYKKEFKLGGFNALIYYGNDDKRPGSEQIILLFGDNSFVNMALGQIPANQPAVRKEVLAGLLSLYVDTSVTVDPTELANFTLNTDKTEFKFFNSASQMFFYTVGGKDPAQNPYDNQIMVMTLPAMKQEQFKAYAISMIDRYKNSGMVIPDYVGKDTTINGKYAYQITFEASYEGKKNSGYQIVTGNENASILFIGGLYDRVEQLMPQVRSIAGSLRVK